MLEFPGGCRIRSAISADCTASAETLDVLRALTTFCVSLSWPKVIAVLRLSASIVTLEWFASLEAYSLARMGAAGSAKGCCSAVKEWLGVLASDLDWIGGNPVLPSFMNWES